jgi:hypothetical protein
MNILKSVILFSLLAQSCQPNATIKNNQPQVLVAFDDTTKQYGWGYKDLNGNIVIAPQYAGVEPDTFSKAIAFVLEKRYDMNDDRHGWVAIDRQNKFILKPFWFDMAPDELSEGLFRFVENGRVGEGGKMGFSDENGHKIIPAKFTFVDKFSEGMASFCNDCQKKDEGEHWLMVGKFGFIDKTGKEVIPAQFDDITEEFHNGKATVIKNNQQIIINSKGEQIK